VRDRKASGGSAPFAAGTSPERIAVPCIGVTRLPRSKSPLVTAATLAGGDTVSVRRYGQRDVAHSGGLTAFAGCSRLAHDRLTQVGVAAGDGSHSCRRRYGQRAAIRSA